MPFADAFAAIHAGQVTPEVLAEALATITDAGLDATRLDHIDEILATLDGVTDRQARLLRVEILLYRHEGQIAMAELRELAGTPPDPAIVERLLDMHDGHGSGSFAEQRFWDAYLATLPEGLPRAQVAAHLAALHSNVGLDEAAAAWMGRAVAFYPGEDRPQRLRAFLEDKRLGFARDLVR
jgi:hypothetical protein